MPREVRRRYISFKIDCNGELDEKDLNQAIWETTLKLFGEFGASLTHLSLIEYDGKRRMGIVRCSHIALDCVKASLASITRIGKHDAAIQIQLVSGTLKSLRKKIYGHEV
ncbi:MAG: Rpp14/Pop5 family protein [Nitrososphaerota archaeon]|nr:Rpp14/Pop5 family protein [Candidatus Bathyarchaeota archaeon]MDW8048619.1 Rpp14/Pop5 family protein [Nitrososphaerota archaeon]